MIPTCQCHDDPMLYSDGWRCPERRREWDRQRYHQDPSKANYARYRRRLRARITKKKARLKELAKEIYEKENSGRIGEG